MLERLAAADVALFKAVHQALWGTVWLSILQFVQYAGEAVGLVALFAFALAIAPRARRVEVVVRLVAPVGAAAAACELLKRVVNADRPRTVSPQLILNPSPKLPAFYSWPSGHTTAIFAFATAVLLLRLFAELPVRRWTAAAALAFLIALATGLARVAVGAHFPGDVLSGAILGVSVANLTAHAVDAVERRRRASQPSASLH